MHDLLPQISSQLSNVLDSIAYFMPEVNLGLLFIMVLVTDLIFGKRSAGLCRTISCAGLVLVMFKDLQQVALVADGQHFIFSNMLLLSRSGICFKLIIDLLSFILLLYFAWDNKLKGHPKGLSDLYSISIASVFGLHLMVMAVNLLSIYLAIEMVSIASYLMVAYRTENAFSTEAGLKYVLFGAASSAIMLYGISLLYGFSGSLDVVFQNSIIQLSKVNPVSSSFAVILVLIGIGFKLSFVPVHFWVPDVYQGASTPITAYLSTVPKIAAFALIINFLPPFILTSYWKGFDIGIALSIAGIVTMITGNFAAVMQTNIKRMLAYSSIGHTGFALMAVVVLTLQGVSALTYYLLVYALANIGALALANYFTNETGAEEAEDYRGLGLKYPAASVCFVIVLISLTGLPVTAGFTGKLFVFSAVYGIYQQTHSIWLMLLMATGALTTVVSLFYYIKIPLNLFLKRKEMPEITSIKSANLLILSIVISFVLILLGIFPDFVLRYL
ncbi:NADH-quinone oxidoreductase subunit N [Mucilaginibacter sabulilitoris]|uniref:NADH-quinone oxidoreductase subunit N n=1 Tax=Mucilaginibacter sabulilitoris TaxID=1173583 RepID=A0ABZ0TS40_9SPHI|nr:NADH-quinone oxidoreductase subunit N [Mucilaginibacter sabulilitoris]WPU95927.1 NADH-quinone oxidoreductase subunit N [Mucilaginibacter sabulilitoris]